MSPLNITNNTVDDLHFKIFKPLSPVISIANRPTKKNEPRKPCT